MADTLRDEILDAFCRNRTFLLVAVGFVGVFLVLTTVGFTVIEPGTATYTVNQINMIALSALFVVFGLLTVYCFRRDYTDEW